MIVKALWDPKPVNDSRFSVRVYERTGIPPFTYTEVARVDEPATSVLIPLPKPGVHIYLARGYNGREEGPDSNTYTIDILAPPGPVTNFVINIV